MCISFNTRMIHGWREVDRTALNALWEHLPVAHFCQSRRIRVVPKHVFEGPQEATLEGSGADGSDGTPLATTTSKNVDEYAVLYMTLQRKSL